MVRPTGLLPGTENDSATLTPVVAEKAKVDGVPTEEVVESSHSSPTNDPVAS